MSLHELMTLNRFKSNAVTSSHINVKYHKYHHPLHGTKYLLTGRSGLRMRKINRFFFKALIKNKKAMICLKNTKFISLTNITIYGGMWFWVPPRNIHIVKRRRNENVLFGEQCTFLGVKIKYVFIVIQ